MRTRWGLGGACALLLLLLLLMAVQREPGACFAWLRSPGKTTSHGKLFCVPQSKRRIQPASTRCFCSTHGTDLKKSNAHRAIVAALSTMLHHRISLALLLLTSTPPRAHTVVIGAIGRRHGGGTTTTKTGTSRSM